MTPERSAEDHHDVTLGEILLEEFLKPLNLSSADFAAEMGVSPKQLKTNSRKNPVPEPLVARFAMKFSTTRGFWRNLR